MKSKKRVLMVAPQPFFRPRGTPFSVLHRIRALSNGGFRVDLVTYPFGEDIALPGLRIIRSGRPPLVRDVKIGPSVAKVLLDIPLYRTTVEMLKSGEYDILHSHEEAAFFCTRLARRHGLLHVYDMHSSLPQQLANFSAYNLSFLRRVFENLERKTLQNADGVITICDELAEIARRIAPTVPHSMIENTGDDRTVFAASPGDIRSQLGIGSAKVIVYTGTLEPYQGIDLLLDAMPAVLADCPSALLLVVGGNPAQVESYGQRASQLGIAESVIFTGTVSPAEIPSYLDAADLIVSPRSRGTNTPLKIYGYLRAGKPLVATDKLTHTQTLSRDNACLVEPTAEGLAAGLLGVLKDPAMAARLARGAAQLAAERFSDDAYVHAVLDIYERILSSTSSQPPKRTSIRIGARGTEAPHVD